jgi:hypothetical protein
VSDYFKKTCKTCRHWQKQPRRVGPDGAVDMSTPVSGVCRAVPPVVTLFPQQSGQVVMRLDYPIPQGDFPACGKHEESSARVTSENGLAFPAPGG